MSVSSRRLAFGGIMTALGTVIIILSVILQFATFILPALSGLIVLFSAFEVDYKFSIKVYFSISVLSLVLSPDKSSAILFISLLGYYPLLKFKIESIGKKFKIIKFMLKLLLFNSVLLIYYIVLVYLFGTSENVLHFLGIYMPFVFLVILNIMFFMYDRCILQVFTVFIYKVRSKIPFKII